MTATLTLADVARLTGVTRPAVNEWIQRFNSESIAPFPSTRSRSSSTSFWICGLSPSMRFAVKALETSPRSRVWSGGS